MTASSRLPAFLRSQFPSKFTTDPKIEDLASRSNDVYPELKYDEKEQAEIAKWTLACTDLNSSSQKNEAAEFLKSLNSHLSSRTTILGSKPSVADLAVYVHLAPLVRTWTPEERTGEQGYHSIVRHIDSVQNLSMFEVCIRSEEKVNIDPSDVRFVHKPRDAKAEKELKKKEKEKAAALAASGATKDIAQGTESTIPIGKGRPPPKSDVSGITSNIVEPQPDENFLTTRTEAAPTNKKDKKKEKPPKAPKPNPPTTAVPLSPCLIDLRVGHILKAIPHPDADSLYVSTIDCGDPAGTDNTTEYEGHVVRTVCSGLNGLVPLAEMQGRKIVTVCNLKPVKMRGVLSSAMVLAASPRPTNDQEDSHSHGGPVELVDPPSDATAGEPCTFSGWSGKSEGILNPKKKLFETLQPAFGTDASGQCVFERSRVETLPEGPDVGILTTKSGGICKVKSLRGALVR